MFKENAYHEKIASTDNTLLSLEKTLEENPNNFCVWFKENIIQKINDWQGKINLNKTLKNAIVYGSIPFAIFSAGEQKATAEDVVSEFQNRQTLSSELKSRGEILPECFDSKDIYVNKDKKIELVERINLELYALDKISESFNENLDNSNKNIIDFSGVMEKNIKDTNNYLSRLKQGGDLDDKTKNHSKKVLDNGIINFKEFIKLFQEIVLAMNINLLKHEIGHQDKADELGIDTVMHIRPFDGEVKPKTKIPKMFVGDFQGAGINASQKWSEFLVNNLRSSDKLPDQILAIAALLAKSDGMIYMIKYNMFLGKDNDGNDIVNYSKNTGVSVDKIVLGLALSSIMDTDNLSLIKKAFGNEGVKISDSALSILYELGERGPITGIKYKGVW